MTDLDKTLDKALRRARLEALEEASAEAQRLAMLWGDEAGEMHSDRQRSLRLAWSDAAQKVADAITALGRR